MLFCRPVDRIFMKRVTNSMHSPTYNLMLWNIIWPVTMQFFNLAYMLPYIGLMRRRGHKEYTRGFLLPGNPAATSTGPISSCSLACSPWGVSLHVPGGPSVAFISVAMMSVMANTTQYLSWSSPPSSCAHVSRRSTMQVAFWSWSQFSWVYLASCQGMIARRLECKREIASSRTKVLTALSMSFPLQNICCGMACTYFPIFPSCRLCVPAACVTVTPSGDCLWTWWSGLFQIPWGLLCIPLFWIKLPGQEQLPADQTLTGLLDTLSCMCGYIQHPGDEACATSPPPIFWYVIYLAFNVSWVVLQFVAHKVLSALWTAVATVLCMDLTNIFGMIPFLAGGGAQTMSLNDWLATILASVALWNYSLEPEERGHRSKAEQRIEDERESLPHTASKWSFRRIREQFLKNCRSRLTIFW